MYDVQDGLHEGHVSDGDACKPIAGGLHGWLHNMTAKSKSGHWLKGHGPSRSLTPQELGSSGAWLLVWGSPFSIISLLLFSAEVAMSLQSTIWKAFLFSSVLLVERLAT